MHARKASQPEWLCLDEEWRSVRGPQIINYFIPRLVDEPLSHHHKIVLLMWLSARISLLAGNGEP